MIDVVQIRKDFLQLESGSAFLDSAASSLTPTQVVRAMDEYYLHYRANVHRGLYSSALRASDAYESGRAAVKKFIGAEGVHEVIFTGGATESSNIAVRMLEIYLDLKAGDEIVTTVMEHHSSLVPLQQLAKRTGATLRIIPLEQGTVRLNIVKAAEFITPKTKLVSAMHASNVTGHINDISELALLAHKVGAVIIVDGTASVGHVPISVRELGIDMLYFSAHKMLGPTGMGVLWVKDQLLGKLEPATWGGGMIERVSEEAASWAPVPDRFEAGTKNIGGVIGLGAAINYLEAIGVDNIHEHVAGLLGGAIKQLEEIPGVTLYTELDTDLNMGNIAFTVDGVHPHDVAQILAQEGVAVRPGHHCAQPLHKALGVSATTRASFYLYNTVADIEVLVRGIKKAQKTFS